MGPGSRLLAATALAAVLALGGVMYGSGSVLAAEPTLSVLSANARCDEPLTFVGSGYEPSTEVAVAIPAMADSTVLVVTTTDERGNLNASITSYEYATGGCPFGAEVLFFAGSGMDELRTLATTVFAFATPWRLSLVSCNPLVIEGEGFVPARDYAVWGGDDTPQVHDVAPVGSGVTSDREGHLRLEVSRDYCGGTGALFVRFADVREGDPLIVARLSLPSGIQSAPPLPADTGHGRGLTTEEEGDTPYLMLAVFLGLLAALPAVRARHGRRPAPSALGEKPQGER